MMTAMTRASSQLTVLASTTVIAAHCLCVDILFRLAGYTQADTRNSFAPRRRNLFVALFTVAQAFAAQHLVSHPFDRIIDARIDLILNSSVLCKTASHLESP